MHTPRTCPRVRRYRGAFRTLGRAVDWWTYLVRTLTPTRTRTLTLTRTLSRWNLLVEPPTFIAQLGDIIDGVNVELGQSERALEARA